MKWSVCRRENVWYGNYGNSSLQDGKAALHLAAENGHEDIADLLLAHKAFVNAKTKLGLTPLHLAAQNGSTHLVRLLVETHMASTDALSLVSEHYILTIIISLTAY